MEDSKYGNERCKFRQARKWSGCGADQKGPVVSRSDVLMGVPMVSPAWSDDVELAKI